MTIRNIRFKYASTFLGIIWAGLIPLFLIGAIGLVFVKIIGVSQDNFHVFVLSALISWLYFSKVLVESTDAFNISSLNKHMPELNFVFNSSVGLEIVEDDYYKGVTNLKFLPNLRDGDFEIKIKI